MSDLKGWPSAPEKANGEPLGAGADLSVRTGDNGIAGFQSQRSQDVAFFTVFVEQQRDARGAVRIVLDCGNLGGHAVLVALEVDDAVLALGAAALMPDGDAAGEVAAGPLAHIGSGF